MELAALYQRVIGLDVHQALITTVCAIIYESERTACVEQRQFGTFKRDRMSLRCERHQSNRINRLR